MGKFASLTQSDAISKFSGHFIQKFDQIRRQSETMNRPILTDFLLKICLFHRVIGSNRVKVRRDFKDAERLEGGLIMCAYPGCTDKATDQHHLDRHHERNHGDSRSPDYIRKDRPQQSESSDADNY